MAALVAGCAKPPSDHARLTTAALPTGEAVAILSQDMPAPLTASGDQHEAAPLAGRDLVVATVADLRKLAPKEVILTFDDGPHPSITPKILATLDKYGVKATFFMVGTMATSYSSVARQVALAGHTVGAHSHNHENLSAITFEAAQEVLAKGDGEIAAALKPAGRKMAPFFRFPYLLETRALRADLSGAGTVIFGVDIDSWDYLDQTNEEILNRTLRRLDAKGKGVVLFHDIQPHTAVLLPDFLDALIERGYKVVHAVPQDQSVPDIRAVLASL